jgi:hypothetical protein
MPISRDLTIHKEDPTRGASSISAFKQGQLDDSFYAATATAPKDAHVDIFK